MLDAYWQYPAAGPKWLVLGEFRELGQESQAQHLQLADYLTRYQDQYQMLVLISPEMQHWVYPVMRSRIGQFRVKSFTTAGEAYRWLWENLRGGETILLKGSQGRHLEGIVEGLLADPADSARLSCRNPIFRPAQEEILSYVNKQQEQGTP